MAGSRVGLFDNLNIPIHRDAQHREDCRIPDRAVRGDRAAGAEPGPAQTSYNLYDAYRAATARPCARPTRAGPIVLACERIRTQVAQRKPFFICVC